MQPVVGEDLDNGEERHLLNLLTTRCFTECIEQNMTPDECAAYIESVIGEAGGHEVGPVTVKIQVPRTPVVFGSSYWMVEVPVNVNGQFTCDRNMGETFYPFLWTAPGGDLAVANMLCQGLSAGECCMMIRTYGQAELGGKDTNGNCFACFAYQEPLVPVVNTISGLTEYRDYVYNDPNCEQMQLTESEVASADADTQMTIDAALTSLSVFADAPSCVVFAALLEGLYNAATVITPLSPAIGELACSYCYGPNDLDVMALGPADPLIAYLMTLLSTPAPSSAENCVIIYTNDSGDIVDIPKLGGSRADDPYDDDCEEEAISNDCPNGYFWAGEECEPCAMGAFEEGGFCLPCEPGTFGGATGLSACTPCADREIAPAPGGASSCTVCDEGSISVGGVKCEICPAGTGQRFDLNNECVPCYVGLYQPNPGQNFCLQCPRGSMQPLIGQVSCNQCPPNWVQPGRGETECAPCPPGTVEGSRDKCVPAL
jgi:hypothetical protein